MEHRNGETAQGSDVQEEEARGALLPRHAVGRRRRRQGSVYSLPQSTSTVPNPVLSLLTDQLQGGHVLSCCRIKVCRHYLRILRSTEVVVNALKSLASSIRGSE